LIPAWESRSVDTQTRTDPETLILEISRYLTAVDLFRAERCEPTWRPEALSPADPGRAPAHIGHAHSAH
jgi:hypothetical protein